MVTGAAGGNVIGVAGTVVPGSLECPKIKVDGFCKAAIP